MLSYSKVKAAFVCFALACLAAGCATLPYRQGALPEYPWPPETPSSRVQLTSEVHGKVAAGSLGGLYAILVDSLVAAKYPDHSVYSAPGGFVLATTVEAIDKNGRRKAHTELATEDDFLSSLRSIFFSAKPGYYRFILFVVTDQSYTYSKEKLSDREAAERLGGGANRLPKEISDLPFRPSHTIDALIYEFRTPAKAGSDEIIVPGEVPPDQHLKRSGIWDALKRHPYYVK
jgi:hypothetical protein